MQGGTIEAKDRAELSDAAQLLGDADPLFEAARLQPVRAQRHLDLLPSSVTVKRAIDLVVALVGLVVFAPLGTLVAVAIWIDSPGPALFRQKRIGRGGQPFEMLKFRTMLVDAHSRRCELEQLCKRGGVFKLNNDPRLTRIGRVLRRISVDEAPQLVNVLRGEMSLVGPRPLIPEEDQLIEGPYRARLDVTPGMTGPWQAVGPVRPPLRQMVIMDCLYATQRSLWADVKILWRTIWHVIRLRGV